MADESASKRIDRIIAQLGDWRGEHLAKVRKLILDADRDAVEEIKWVKPSNPGGVATWTHGRILCTGEVYKAHVKVTFPDGASLDDPKGLFTSSLDGATRRAIDLPEGAKLDATAFTALVRAAVAYTEAKAPPKKT